ncbi:IS3 family transposase [Mesobacillus harenae]|uniref:IS3 family transposase n=1 Tax=Mesobacillus harenae TaxID=2213203 RepID=UPI003BB15074
MFRKGNCWDNAPMESFFGHFKDLAEFKSCGTFNEIEVEVDRVIEYYNCQRYQWGLKKMTLRWPFSSRCHITFRSRLPLYPS